jgi:RecA-family ATPase
VSWAGLSNDRLGSKVMVHQRLQSGSLTPSLLILDTLSRYFGEGDDENSAKDMKRFIGATGKLLSKYPNLHIMIVHHSGKDQERGMRGSSALQGAADTVIKCYKNDKKHSHTAIVEKQKDGEDSFCHVFLLMP